MQSFLTAKNKQQSAHTAQSSIRKKEGVCGGRARIRKTRIPVWLIVGFLKDGATENEILDLYPDLTQEDIRKAWEYYKENPEEIEQDLIDNEVI